MAARKEIYSIDSMIHLKKSGISVCTFLCLILCLNKQAHGGSYFLPSSVDSLPAKSVEIVRVTVKDIADESYIDSAYVILGIKSGYTNSQGYIELEKPAGTEATVFIHKSGYYTFSKKPRTNMVVHLTRKYANNGLALINNGMYERPVEHFSGLATIINGNQLRQINSLNFAEALKYYDPAFLVARDNNNGDNPNLTPDIKIRGRYNFPAAATIASAPGTAPSGVQVNPSSADFIADNIAKSNQPAFFVNGVQVALQSALDIDINRIETVTILKDAAATAQYGGGGGNGVVLIQTIRPLSGPMNIHYSGQVQVSNADLSSYQLMDWWQKLKLEQENGMYTTNQPLLQARQKQLDKNGATDWLQVPLRSGISSKHSLALDGGDDNMTYGLDFTYNDVEGAMKGSSRKNTSFGGYISSRIKNIAFSNYITFSKTNAVNSPFGSFDAYAKQNPYWNPFDSATGKMTKLIEDVTILGTSYRFYNPAYNGTLSTKDARDYSRLANTTNINWNLGHGFKLNGLLGYSRQSEQTNQFLPPGHTLYANYPPDSFFKRGFYFQNNSGFTSTEASLKLNYDKKIGLHQLYATAGGSAMQTGSESTGISVSGFTSDKLSDISFGSGYTNQRPTAGKVVTKLASGFGNLTYSFDNRYQAEVSGSADASSQFGSNQQVASHWSAAAGWNLHQERFFNSNKILSQFRLHASIGTAGEYSFLSYLGRTSYNYYTDKQYIQGSSGTSTRGIGLGAFLTGFANDSLKAPQTYKQNLGLDAAFFQSRLTIRVDAYRQKTTGIILPLVSPSYTGFQGFSYYDNVGAIENKGLEFTLNYNIIRNSRKSIYWNISVNGLHNEDRIAATGPYIDKFNAMNDAMAVDQTSPQQRFVVGQSLTGIWAVRSRGIDASTGKEVFLKSDGTKTNTWNAADKVLVGDMTPKWQGSFGTSFSFKNISAGIYFNYQLDVQGYNQTLADKVENASLMYNTDVRAGYSRWKQAGDIVSLKPVLLNGMLTSPTYATSRFVQNNDFINCSAISIGYALPQHLAAKIGAQSLKIGLMGNNLFRWQAMKAERGIYYPFQQQYSLSVNANF